VDLSTYYLSDFGGYWKEPAAVPTVDGGDFIARFPAGATIPAHGVITVALDTAASFHTTYPAANADYALVGGTMTVLASSGTMTLTNGGELVALFQWDGQADVVRDVDLMIAGVATAPNGLLTKSGVAQDGPDVGTTATAYAADANTLTIQATAPANGKSTKRLLLEAGHETQAGTSNGLGGDDETSEQTATTWDTTFAAPTPGAVPAALLP
jgi:hypothetical protein